MYEYILGKIIELNPTYLVIEAGQIGYNINISLTTYAALEGKSEAKIYVQHIVREDAQLFYGFADKREREVFNLLTSVSGVGVNTARLILSSYTSAELANVIMSDDVVAIKGVKGIGLKTAQKIIIELKDKIKGYADDGDSSSPAGSAAIQAKQEAVAALVMMDCAQNAQITNVVRMGRNVLQSQMVVPLVVLMEPVLGVMMDMAFLRMENVTNVEHAAMKIHAEIHLRRASALTKKHACVNNALMDWCHLKMEEAV